MALQADAITNRILQDAEIKAQEIKNSCELKCQEILLEAQNYAKQMQKDCKDLAKTKQKEIKDKYLTLAKIEGNKIVLKSKQLVLEGVKQKALDFLCAQNKEETVKFVAKLIEKNAEKEDLVVFNLGNIKEDDIKEIDCIKSLGLKVKYDKTLAYGILLCGKNCDKNLLFKTLVDNAFNDLEKEICFTLFN